VGLRHRSARAIDPVRAGVVIGRRKAHKDSVSPDLHREVIRRDIAFAGGCVQAFLDSEHECRNIWGDPQHPGRDLQTDHIQDGYGRTGKRAKSDVHHLVSLCAASHLNGWATSHRPLLREYLERVNRGAA
jgi:hypothetical protein